MTAQTLVCDKWPLELQSGSGGHFAYLGTISKKNTSCFLHLVTGLPQGMSTVEYFGGVGQFSTIIQQVLHPRSHYAFDIDIDCVNQLRSLRDVRASQGDAMETMGTVPADLVVLDFAYATVKHHGEWPWERVLDRKPRYVVFSDTALRRLGLHRALYSKIFGCPIETHRDYVLAYSRKLFEHYGYSVTRECHHQYSYMLLEPVAYSEGIEMTKVTR